MLPKKANLNLGKQGEKFASEILQSRGYKIIKQNFRSKFGEIDIIAIKDNCLIFIEVKTRYSQKFGSPEEAVTWTKLNRIKKTAQYFSLLNPELPKKLKIEVVALELLNGKVYSAKIIQVE
jgi:putative endonuclease